jgi:hypothetical protein
LSYDRASPNQHRERERGGPSRSPGALLHRHTTPAVSERRPNWSRPSFAPRRCATACSPYHISSGRQPASELPITCNRGTRLRGAAPGRTATATSSLASFPPTPNPVAGTEAASRIVILRLRSISPPVRATHVLARIPSVSVLASVLYPTAVAWPGPWFQGRSFARRRPATRLPST